MRVLLIEDDLTSARGTTLIFKSANAIVDHSDTGEEALEILRHYDYDILVLDLMLPDIDGYEVIRRSKGFSQPKLHVGPLQLDLDSKEVFVSGKQVHLTGKEYAILELMVLRKGMVLTKEAFLNHLYGGIDEPEVKIIDVFVCKLRKKLSIATAGENYIETVWGRGYVLRDPPADAEGASAPHQEPVAVAMGAKA